MRTRLTVATDRLVGPMGTSIRSVPLNVGGSRVAMVATSPRLGRRSGVKESEAIGEPFPITSGGKSRTPIPVSSRLVSLQSMTRSFENGSQEVAHSSVAVLKRNEEAVLELADELDEPACGTPTITVRHASMIAARSSSKRPVDRGACMTWRLSAEPSFARGIR